MTQLQIAGVDVRSGIDDERAPARGDLNAQRIVWPVRTAAVDARAACVEAEITIVFPHDIKPGLGKSSGRLVEKLQIGIVENLGADAQKIRVIVGAPRFDRQHLSAVRVANQWRESVGTQIRAYVPE